MYVPVLGYFIDVEEAIVVLCIVIVAYLAVMHIEFKQLKLISHKFSKEETEFIKCIRDLKTDLNNLSDLIRTKELKTISSHVTGTTAETAATNTASSSDESSAQDRKSKPGQDNKEAEDKSKTDTDQVPSDSASLKDMLDKV